MMLKLPVSRMEELFARVDSQRELYLPVGSGGANRFGRWTPGTPCSPDRLNTATSPKGLFFPQTENIAAFKVRGREITVEENRDPAAPFALFGVRGCDAASLDILDRVFLSDPTDTFYQARRQNGVLITLACPRPEESCFCGVFGIDPAAPGGDVSSWIIDQTLYWESRTQKGNELTAILEDLLEKADDRDAQAVSQWQSGIRDTLSRLKLGSLSLEGFGENSLGEKFASPLWEELSRTCLGCGSCTFVCPTCHCYDIQDFDTGREIRRFRCWDSCMYSDFTLMAHGNPRQSQLERFRQRFMHKLVYYPANNEGIIACVGCGRCVTKCPVSMNIAKVIKALGVQKDV